MQETAVALDRDCFTCHKKANFVLRAIFVIRYVPFLLSDTSAIKNNYAVLPGTKELRGSR